MAAQIVTSFELARSSEHAMALLPADVDYLPRAMKTRLEEVFLKRGYKLPAWTPHVGRGRQVQLMRERTRKQLERQVAANDREAMELKDKNLRLLLAMSKRWKKGLDKRVIRDREDYVVFNAIRINVLKSESAYIKLLLASTLIRKDKH
jgi:hypothetical protein